LHIPRGRYYYVLPAGEKPPRRYVRPVGYVKDGYVERFRGIEDAPVDPKTLRVSVVVPCKDERGNIEDAVTRIPELGHATEIIFCDDKSTDGTADEVRRMQKLHPDRNIRLVDGPGICKSKNVWAGFDSATGDILMILDADLTVMPEELPYFIDAITRSYEKMIAVEEKATRAANAAKAAKEAEEAVGSRKRLAR